MRDKSLLQRLEEYSHTDVYPFHMPGHKRQTPEPFACHFPNPYAVDITEIHGFDNLHHPEGILRDSMGWAAQVYGADQTYYLVGGSSCGVLSAVCGAAPHGSKILMSRNCHKSAYHGVFLNHLRAEYVYPQILPEWGIQGGLLAKDVEKLLISDREIRAVLVVSPTYDGVVSDIEGIAKAAHAHGVPLLVDEAHGAHFIYGESFPKSALELGADVVVQSLHKTLPAFTQSAVMHVRKGYVDLERIDRYVHMFQSSSPSYVLMAGIENCLRWMDSDGREQMKVFEKRLDEVRKSLGGMRRLRLLNSEWVGRFGVFDLDRSKIVVSCAGTGMSGVRLEEVLREIYGLEMEMCGADYVTAITTLADTEEGLLRLRDAYLEIDEKLGESREIAGEWGGVSQEIAGERGGAGQGIAGEWGGISQEIAGERDGVGQGIAGEQGGVSQGIAGEQGSAGQEPANEQRPEICMTIAEAMDAPYETISIEVCAGRISAEFVYLYPPGIPIVAPGERIGAETAAHIQEYLRIGLPVQGTADPSAATLHVVKFSE